ncbi:MAG: transpeptidase family protein [Bacteroidales bacterium]|nr:transpeptidase family protein [Bacteroidales bacterium]
MSVKARNIKSDIMWRVGLVFISFVLFAALVVGRIFYLNLFMSQELLEKSAKFSNKDVIIMPNRGDIKADDGSLLATTLPKYELRMDMKSPAITQDIFDSNVDSLAWMLFWLFKDKSYAKYKSDLITARKRSNRYFLLQNNVSYPQLKKAKTFPILRKGQYKGGLIIVEKSKREKPFDMLAARTIGFLIEDKQNERKGFVGLERAYDDFLRGEKGVSLIRRISNNRVMPISEEVPPVDGADIITTINPRFQDIVETELLSAMQKHDADYGTAVLMEVKTGAVKAIANLEKNIRGDFSESYNHAIGTSIEPGSVFKLASLIVALEDGVVKLTDSIDTEGGRKKYYDRVMIDDHEGDGVITVQQAFEHSSNVAISKIIVQNYQNDPRRFVERLYKMNLNEKLGLKIKGEGMPLIKYPDDPTWSGVTLPWMSTGYEIHLTPLQVLAFYNAVANDGRLVRPYFVSEIEKHGKVIKSFGTEVINPSICSKPTIAKAKQLLRGVVENGTAQNINSEILPISGKTGTAQIANRSTGYISESGISYNVSFVGYFPSDDPQYSCIVVVNNPKRAGFYGSSVAAPVFKKIANKVYAMSLDAVPSIKQKEFQAQVPYRMHGHKSDIDYIVGFNKILNQDKTEQYGWVRATAKDSTLVIIDKFIATSRVPDVKGLGLKDAVFILENAGLVVVTYGKGHVKKQSLPVGQGFSKGERIVLELG